MRIKADNEIDFIREILRQTIWSVLYDEGELPKAHKTVAVIIATIRHGFPEIDIETIEPDENADAEGTETPTEYISACLASALHLVEYREDELTNSHKILGIVKAILARGNYEIAIDQIYAEQAKRLKDAT